MTSESTTVAPSSRKSRTLVRAGLALLIAGMVLTCFAEPMSRVYLSRDAHGSVSTIDEGRMGVIQEVGDKISWLGIALTVVGAFAWVKRPEEGENSE